MVSLSSIKNHRFDETCIIKPEDNAHEFIRVDSFVDYSKARLQETASIDRGITVVSSWSRVLLMLIALKE